MNKVYVDVVAEFRKMDAWFRYFLFGRMAENIALIRF